MSYTIGGWQPALNASKLRAVLLGSNINDADWVFLARLANDIDKPTAPSLLGSFTSFSPDGDGNADVNSGVIDLTSLSLSSYQFIQILLALRMKSAGSDPKAFLKVAAAISYT